MDRIRKSKGIVFYGIALIAFGFYNLLGLGDYKQFSLMFKPLPKAIILIVYVFTAFYAICGIYCGPKILKFKNWARSMIVMLTSVSVILGFIFNRIVISNFKEFVLSGTSEISLSMADTVYVCAVIFIAVITTFELSLIYFFTRPAVIEQFKSSEI
ncbi:MAG: hypothetical protein ABH869_02790 [Candidatus Omnitrophota bacterium]